MKFSLSTLDAAIFTVTMTATQVWAAPALRGSTISSASRPSARSLWQLDRCRAFDNKDCDADHPVPVFCSTGGERGCCPLDIWTHWDDGADDCSTSPLARQPASSRRWQLDRCRARDSQKCDADHPMPAVCTDGELGCCPLNVWAHWDDGTDDCEPSPSASPSASPLASSPPTGQLRCRAGDNQQCDANYPMPAVCSTDDGQGQEGGCCPLDVWTHWDDEADDCEYPYEDGYDRYLLDSEIFLSVPIGTTTDNIVESLEVAIQNVTNLTTILAVGGERGPLAHVGKMDCNNFPSQNGQDNSDKDCYLVKASLDEGDRPYYENYSQAELDPYNESYSQAEFDFFMHTVKETKFDGTLQWELTKKEPDFTVHKITSGQLYVAVDKSNDEREDVFYAIRDDFEDLMDGMELPDDVSVKILAPGPEQYPTITIDKGFPGVIEYGEIDCSAFLKNTYEGLRYYFWLQVYDNMGMSFVGDYNSRRDCYKMGVVVESSDSSDVVGAIKDIVGDHEDYTFVVYD